MTDIRTDYKINQEQFDSLVDAGIIDEETGEMLPQTFGDGLADWDHDHE